MGHLQLHKDVAVIRDHVPARCTEALVTAMARWMSRWLGVEGESPLDTLNQMATVAQDVWWTTPKLWGAEPWGAQCRLGWQPLGVEHCTV